MSNHTVMVVIHWPDNKWEDNYTENNYLINALHGVISELKHTPLHGQDATTKTYINRMGRMYAEVISKPQED